jgi:hypothetical protein
MMTAVAAAGIVEVQKETANATARDDGCDENS